MIWMKDWLVDAENVMDKKNVNCSGNTVKGEIIYIYCFASADLNKFQNNCQ